MWGLKTSETVSEQISASIIPISSWYLKEETEHFVLKG